jgi:hypothetical protein
VRRLVATDCNRSLNGFQVFSNQGNRQPGWCQNLAPAQALLTLCIQRCMGFLTTSSITPRSTPRAVAREAGGRCCVSCFISLPRWPWELAPPIHPASNGSQRQRWVLGSSSCHGPGLLGFCCLWLWLIAVAGGWSVVMQWVYGHY